MRFFKYEKMYCTKHQLAAFRQRKGQKSSDKKLYLMEAKQSLQVNYKQLDFLDSSIIVFLRLIKKFFVGSKHKYLNSFYNKVFDLFIGKLKMVNTCKEEV